MSAVEFYHDNFLLDAEIVGQYGQNDLFPAENIVDPRTTKIFKAINTVAASWAFFDLGEAKSPTSFIMKIDPFTTHLPFAGFVTAHSNSFDPTTISRTGAQGFISGRFSLRRSSFDKFKIAINTNNRSTDAFRYWALGSHDSSPRNRVNGVHTSFLGVKTLGLENIGIDYGWSIATNSLDKITKNRYGQKFIDKVIQQRVLNLGIRLINKDELDIFMDMFSAVGTHRPVWIVIDPDEVIFNAKERFMIYGYFTAIPTITNNVFSHYDLDLVIEEAI